MWCSLRQQRSEDPFLLAVVWDENRQRYGSAWITHLPVFMISRLIPKRTIVFNSTRSFTHSSRSLGKPWFVEDEAEPTLATTPATPTPAKVIIKPPHPNVPNHLASIYTFLANSPLIDPSSIHIGPPVPAHAHPDADLPLPFLKKVLKSRGRTPKVAGYGRGVGEGRGQGVYQWEVGL